MAYSQPINIIRYSNGTLVRLTGSAEEFQSYDYNAETGAGTFTPDSIVITADYQGDLSYGKWQYSTDGKTFANAVNTQHGMTFTDIGCMKNDWPRVYQFIIDDCFTLITRRIL